MMVARSQILSFFAIATAAFVVAASAARQEEPPARDLGRAWSEYRSLPPEQRQHLLRLDRELHDEELPDRERYFKVMQRYVEWLEKLPAEQRNLIESPSSAHEKLQRIRAVREQQWIANLAKADRDRIAAAERMDRAPLGGLISAVNPLAAAFVPALPWRDAVIAQIRREEHQREEKLQETLAQVGDAAALVREHQRQFRKDLAEWSNSILEVKQLTAEELRRVRGGFGKFGPDYFRTLAEVARKYEVKPPDRLRPRLELLQLDLPYPPEQKWKQFLAKKAGLGGPEWKDFESRLKDPDQRPQAEVDLIKRFWKENEDLLHRLREQSRTNRPR